MFFMSLASHIQHGQENQFHFYRYQQVVSITFLIIRKIVMQCVLSVAFLNVFARSFLASKRYTFSAIKLSVPIADISFVGIATYSAFITIIGFLIVIHKIKTLLLMNRGISYYFSKNFGFIFLNH